MARLRVGGSPPDAWLTLSLPVSAVIGIQRNLLEARADFLAAGDVATADSIAIIYDRYVTDLKNVARKTAALMDREARKRFDATQRRPDSARGSVKLRDAIKSDAWDPIAEVATGWVSLGMIEELDKAVNPYSTSRDPYWRVQEYGFQFRHTPRGFFFGPGYIGKSRPMQPPPSPLHPLFVPTKKGGKFMRPPRVRARHFLREGTKAAVTYWRAETDALVAKTAAELRRVLARRGLGPPPRRR